MNKTTKALSLAVAMFAITGMTGAFSNQALAANAFEGCSSGHWKNDADKRDEDDFDDTGFNPDDKWNEILGGTLDPITIRVKDGPGKPMETSDPTLLQMLNARGGGINALAREMAAALLNEGHGDIHYFKDQGELVTFFNAAIGGGQALVETTRATLFANNHIGEEDIPICPA